MSDSEPDYSNFPSAEECDKRCKDFASITQTDATLALFFLQDRNWDLQASLSDYYQSVDIEKGEKIVYACSSGDFPAMSRHLSKEKAPENEKIMNFVDPEPHRIRVLSWNIDGLDQSSIQTRAKAVCRTIESEKPDVVYLQEVVAKNMEVIEKQCGRDYEIVLGTEEDEVPSMQYFTAMLLRRCTTEHFSHDVMPFSTSVMSRTLLHLKAKVKGIHMSLMTSHLESTKSSESERLKQMGICLNEAAKLPENMVVVFGGDLNLKNSEFEKVKHLIGTLKDVWECTGSKPDAEFTWDILTNDNLIDAQAWRHKPRLRFDRLYYRGAGQLKVIDFKLVGRSRDPDCRRFPSDHWGITALFEKIEPSAEESKDDEGMVQ